MSDTITIIGNIAGDIRHATSGGGVPITSFRVASSQRRYDRATQSWIDGEPNWFSVSAYRNLAVHAYASLQKGQRVIVTGRLKVRRWDSGERSGTAVEIDAEGVGHDLLWGTSAFQRAADTAADGDDSAGEGSAPSAVATGASSESTPAWSPNDAGAAPPASGDGHDDGAGRPEEGAWTVPVTPF